MLTNPSLQVSEVRLEPPPAGDVTLKPSHVILRVNTRDMLNVPEDELLDVFIGLVGYVKYLPLKIIKMSKFC